MAREETSDQPATNPRNATFNAALRTNVCIDRCRMAATMPLDGSFSPRRGWRLLWGPWVTGTPRSATMAISAQCDVTLSFELPTTERGSNHQALRGEPRQFVSVVSESRWSGTGSETGSWKYFVVRTYIQVLVHQVGQCKDCRRPTWMARVNTGCGSQTMMDLFVVRTSVSSHFGFVESCHSFCGA